MRGTLFLKPRMPNPKELWKMVPVPLHAPYGEIWWQNLSNLYYVNFPGSKRFYDALRLGWVLGQNAALLNLIFVLLSGAPFCTTRSLKALPIVWGRSPLF